MWIFIETEVSSGEYPQGFSSLFCQIWQLKTNCFLINTEKHMDD